MNHGLKGRFELYKAKKRWQEHGVFENVEQTGRALQAERGGEDFEQVFEKHRRALKKSQRPRKSTMGHSGGPHSGKHRGRRREEKKTTETGDGKSEAQSKNEEGYFDEKHDEQTNGTVIAGSNTGTDVLDQAVTPGPGPAVQALTNGSWKGDEGNVVANGVPKQNGSATMNGFTHNLVKSISAEA